MREIFSNYRRYYLYSCHDSQKILFFFALFVSENFQHKKVSKYDLSVHTSNIRMLEYSKLKLFAVHKSFIFQMLLLNLNLNVSQTALSFCSIQIFANNSCICLQIAQFIFNRKLMSAFPYWIDSSMTKIIDILYSIISHYIWTIQLALNYLSFMPAIYSYLHRKTINRTKKRKLIRLWVADRRWSISPNSWLVNNSQESSCFVQRP